jgi:hypothetical protein
VEGYDSDQPDQDLNTDATILRGSEEFFSAVGDAQYPFGLVINSADLSQVGTTVYSSPAIWDMFFRILSISVKK